MPAAAAEHPRPQTPARLAPAPRAPAPLAIARDNSSLVLRGTAVGQFCREPGLSGFMARCARLPGLQRVRLDAPAARIELHVAPGHPITAATLRLFAQAMRGAAPSHAWNTVFLEHMSRQVWEAPLVLWRSGPILSTWRVHRFGPNGLRLSHPLLAERPTAEAVAAFLRLRQHAAGFDSLVVRRASLVLRCTPGVPASVARIVAEAEAAEAALSGHSPMPAASPVGGPVLLNANLAAAIGAAVFPPLMLVSAAVLVVASLPVLRQASERLRERRADMSTVLASLSALALVTGNHLPAAAMLWTLRVWDVVTRRRLRWTEAALLQRLAALGAPGQDSLQSAAEAAACIFTNMPRARAARAFADATAPFILCVGAAALMSGGPGVAQAVMRPDFFSPVLVHRRLAAAGLALRLAGLGCVVRDFAVLQQMRDADQIVLDDSVDWQRDGLEDGAFGRAAAELGMREIVLFRAPDSAEDDELAAVLGAHRSIERSLVHTPRDYLSHQGFLGQKPIYARRVGSGEWHAATDVPIAVGPDCLTNEHGAPIGLMQPSLRRLLDVMRLVREADAEERSLKVGTVAFNTVLVMAAAWAGLSTGSIVAMNTAATAGVYAGLHRRLGALP